MIDRTDTSRNDERVTTVLFALGVDDIEPREYEDACDSLASLATDAAETQTLRREVLDLAESRNEALADVEVIEADLVEARAERDAAVAARDTWKLKYEAQTEHAAAIARDHTQAVADRDRLEKVLRVARLIIADTVQPATYEREDVLSRIDAALAGREGSDDA